VIGSHDLSARTADGAAGCEREQIRELVDDIERDVT
jgi:hypothetical protein